MNKFKFFKYMLLSLIIFSIKSNSTSMTNYCAIPPFLNTSVPPNILFVIDVSGSMDWAAYNPEEDGTGFCNNNETCKNTYDENIDYEGYFVPTKVYKYNSNQNYWEETNQSPETCPTREDEIDKNKAYKGSCLNFLYMSRIDLLRWALTGGRPKGCSSFTDDKCDPDLACTGNSCTLEMNNGQNVEVPKSRVKGILQEFENKKNRPRFGALFFSTGIYPDKIYIGDYPNGGNADPNHPYTYLKRAINFIDPNGGTGTAPAMWEAYDYFKQSNDHKYDNGFDISPGTNKDPNYFCDYKGQNCKPVPCAKNFVILASDGQWNIGGYYKGNGYGTCSIDTGFENYSADPVVPAYKMHTEILRTLTTLSGSSVDINVSGVYTLGLFLGGTGEQSLKNVAIYGSFDTNNRTWPDSLSGYPEDTCYMDDCGNGKGSACTPLPSSSPDWDSNGDGIPDNFLNAQNAIQLKDSLLSFIRNILKRTASGTSVSVLSEKDTKGALVAQAVFYPQKNYGDYKVTWIGQLFTYWFLNTKQAQNIREDTNKDYRLTIDNDNIIEFRIDEQGKLYIDVYSSDSTGKKSSLETTYTSLDDINYLWEAGNQLKDRNPDDRVIYSVNKNNSLELFTSNNSSDFDSLLGTDANEFPDCLKNADGTINYGNLIDYIKGKDIQGCRSRVVDSNGDTWKLADIIYSSPQIVYYNDYVVIFTASNDGILHAFKAGKVEKLNNGSDVAQLTGENLGEELWGFIPKHALPYLRYVADPNYCHLYINDLSPYIITADYNNDGTDEIVLIGGLRLGGGCSCSGTDCINPPLDTCSDPSSSDCVGLSEYYALDITDPLNPKLLWEFTNQDLGFAYSGPAFIKRKDDNGNWHYFVMFASGPTSYDGYTNKNLHIFVLNLSNGTLLLNKDFGDSFKNSFGGRLFTNGLDVNEDGQTDFVFLGYSNKTGNATSHGGVIKIWTGSVDPNEWDFNTTYLNFAKNPVTSEIVAEKCFNTWYLFFGTGRYFYKEDDDQDTNYLYGVPFLCDANNNCLTGSINSTHSATDKVDCTTIADKTQGAWSITLNDDEGSYLKERNISKPSFAENIIFFTTTQPTGDICGFGGRTRAWALNCATGEPIGNNQCSGYKIENSIIIKYLVQLSGGDIQQFGTSSFNQVGGRATEFKPGVSSEQGGIPVTPGGILTGELLLWIEK